ncbi:hypothetical protein HQN90_17690 [Paenibacillus alba]|uniref:hypothetical protein n=1 Tax=Paenibacillus alba TaxID=1197127 RepID=UPI0015638891|nr:hypothetical protein [Paenibacillus alba]NQX67957.1 hypothetical protein [Paenibacillus alba]
MLQDALQKIGTEISAEKKNKYAPAVGSFLINHLRNNPQDAGNILTEGKTIAGSLKAMREEAQKNQDGGIGMLSDEEAFNIVLKYYGIHVNEKVPVTMSKVANFDISLDDLM